MRMAVIAALAALALIILAIYRKQVRQFLTQKDYRDRALSALSEKIMPGGFGGDGEMDEMLSGVSIKPDQRYLEELYRRKGNVTELDNTIIREHFVFRGHVQGVGFRFQAMYAANNYDVTGWVENMSDGSVEMELQGTPQGIAMVLGRIRSARWIVIDEMDVNEIPVVEGERGFGVQGY